jgi:hypothetical protein
MSESGIPERWKSDYEHSMVCDLQDCAESRFAACCEELGAAEAKIAEQAAIIVKRESMLDRLNEANEKQLALIKYLAEALKNILENER